VRSEFWVEASVSCYLPTERAFKLSGLKRALLSVQTYDSYWYALSHTPQLGGSTSQDYQVGGFSWPIVGGHSPPDIESMELYLS